MAAADETGPFFHGTLAVLREGDLLVAGRPSNYRPEVVMNHVYFTALPDGGGLAAELAVLLAGAGAPHVYEVEPTGPFEDDPNVTDKKFPGNPTRSYRTTAPLRIVREVHDWTRLTPEARETWRERLATMQRDRAEIIN
ncbi:NAD(+)--rifampin ADP-ribosyltransferase [Curtobacterium sp. SP.BCp]|uniref:NAD(+)--rifampin ADP-ribosyltransferase n=1 Tax=unclassified Curtobacterium TaxID=257496 RepID=UPI0025B3BB4D|nr:NAD(+)--rifampin ADP-ribosyltransferase [Curtobacterium sp. 458]WJY01664.1 NAD(+)--rifampin ADP-ribosyltransferase [Curtobacterium sp. 458]